MSGSTAGNGVAKSATPHVAVEFDRADRVYEPRRELRIHYHIEGVEPEVVRAIERSVLWYTEGKGEEDLGVHSFERIDDPAKLAQASPVGTFMIPLPTSPLSYEGVIVKVRWCVRVRIFFGSGRDFVSEHVFDLGGVPPARGPLERLE
jgi:hypothetical protein